MKKSIVCLVLAFGVALGCIVAYTGPQMARAQESPELIPNDEGFIPRGPFLQFTCKVARLAAIDPATDPEPGHAHQHIFFGHKGIRASSTPQSLAATKEDGTTCRGGGRGGSFASYWVPRIREGGKVMVPVEARPYYTDRREESYLEHQMPPDLTMIANESNGDVKWICLPGERRDSVPYGCESALRVVIIFPQCWQGGNDPDDVVYREEEFCQSGEQQIPNFRLSVDFLPKDRRLDKPLEVNAGDGQWEPASFMHADRMEGNGGDGDGGTTVGFEALVQSCILDMDKGPEQPPSYCFPH